jgi:hypothetical protein
MRKTDPCQVMSRNRLLFRSSRCGLILAGKFRSIAQIPEAEGRADDAEKNQQSDRDKDV